MNLAGIAEFILGNCMDVPTYFLSYADIYSFPMCCIRHLRLSLGQSRIQPGPNASIRRWLPNRCRRCRGCCIQLVSGFPQHHNVRLTCFHLRTNLTDSRTLVSFVFFIGSFRTNVPFVLTFLGLIGLFAFTAAADLAIPTAATAADVAHIDTLIRCAGGFGFLGLICGWYLAIVTSCAAVSIPCPLPVFDLSSKVFPGQNKTHRDASKEV